MCFLIVPECPGSFFVSDCSRQCVDDVHNPDCPELERESALQLQGAVGKRTRVTPDIQSLKQLLFSSPCAG